MIESVFNREDPRDARRRRLESLAAFLTSVPLMVCVRWLLTWLQPEMSASLRSLIVAVVPMLLFLAVKRRLHRSRSNPRDGLGPEVR